MRKITSGNAYLTVNIIFTGVILLVMGYSVFYSPEKNNYPVVCIHEKITGMPCPSCGLSHAFSLIVRGRFSEALSWNPYSIRVFLFFFVQLLMRLTLVIYLSYHNLKTKALQNTDAVVSASMALLTFFPFLVMEWKLLI